ncbi:MAG: rhodanese-like domain-containing protein [Thermoflexales bacterium]
MFGFLFRSGARVKSLTPQQYHQDFRQREHVLVDVRTPAEFRTGHIPGARNIDVQVIDRHLDKLPSDKPIVLYCRSGNRSSIAASILQRAGFTEVYDLGGIGEWVAAGFPIQR